MLQLPVLLRHGHALEVLVVTDGLKVAADQEGVDFVTVLLLELLDVGVDRVEFAVAASLHCDLRVRE